MAERFLIYRQAYPPRKNAEGRYLCRVCGEELEGRMRSFCSDDCRQDALIRCGINVRRYVRERDKGWCARCGMHVPTFADRLQSAFEKLAGRRFLFVSCLTPAKRRRWERFCARVGVQPPILNGKSLWEAHHKHAVKDGGGGAGLADYETLCVWCHHEATADQHRRWANGRKKPDGQQLLAMMGE